MNTPNISYNFMSKNFFFDKYLSLPANKYGHPQEVQNKSNCKVRTCRGNPLLSVMYVVFYQTYSFEYYKLTQETTHTSVICVGFYMAKPRKHTKWYKSDKNIRKHRKETCKCDVWKCFARASDLWTLTHSEKPYKYIVYETLLITLIYKGIHMDWLKILNCNINFKPNASKPN